MNPKIENTSGLEPQGVAVLIKPYEPEFHKTVIIIPETAGDRSKMIENRAIVIAIGGEAWKDEARPRAKVGDKVIVTRYAGVMTIGPLDNQVYRLINDRDIFCTIVAEAQEKEEPALGVGRLTGEMKSGNDIKRIA